MIWSLYADCTVQWQNALYVKNMNLELWCEKLKGTRRKGWYYIYTQLYPVYWLSLETKRCTGWETAKTCFWFYSKTFYAFNVFTAAIPDCFCWLGKEFVLCQPSVCCVEFLKFILSENPQILS